MLHSTIWTARDLQAERPSPLRYLVAAPSRSVVNILIRQARSPHQDRYPLAGDGLILPAFLLAGNLCERSNGYGNSIRGIRALEENLHTC